MFSSEHERLIERHQSAAPVTWSSRALASCLQRLMDGGPTEWAEVTVHDAWVLPDAEGFCMVYTSPWGPRVGYRVSRYGEGGLLSGMSPAQEAKEAPPEYFGIEIADFAIAEPLGSIGQQLVYDSRGLGWWGDAPFPNIGESSA